MENQKTGSKEGSVENKFDYDVVLLDIEGTTTPISFVKDMNKYSEGSSSRDVDQQDVLFPYARDNVRAFLEKSWGTDQCQEDVKALRNQAEKDKDMEDVVLIPDEEENLSQDNSWTSKETIMDAVVANVIWQMNSDRKTTALKQLQGHIWRKAFNDGVVKGEVFDDVVTAFKRWTSNKIKIYIYSSGSTDSQKLLFGNSKFGNILQYISGHFDTTVGAKIDSESYSKIADAVDMKPSRILFITDVVKESRAAFKAGYRTAISVRPGNAPLTDEDKRDFKVISTFDELFEDTEELSHATKKSKVAD